MLKGGKMNNLNKNKQKENIFPATIVKVLSSNKVVINRGSLHKIITGKRFLIYILSNEEIIDPDSGKSLGYLEIVKGKGKVTHVQENMSTIASDEKEIHEERIIRKPYLGPLIEAWSNLAKEENVERIKPSFIPFDDPKIGDKAKPI